MKRGMESLLWQWKHGMRRGLCLLLALTVVLCSSDIWGRRAQAETAAPDAE